MQQPNQDYYNPSTQDGFDNGMVLKPIVFKPLKNIKTGNFFSYSYDVIERNKSANGDQSIRWVTNAPAEMQAKIDKVIKIHDHIVEMKLKLKKIAKKGTQYQKEEMEEQIAEQFLVIDGIIYPENERKFVESHESKRVRLEQQNELKLDEASIAALRGAPAAPMGSTADASIAEAKLKLAQQQLAEMEEQDNAELTEALEEIKKLKASAKRRDTYAKKKEEG